MKWRATSIRVNLAVSSNAKPGDAVLLPLHMQTIPGMGMMAEEKRDSEVLRVGREVTHPPVMENEVALLLSRPQGAQAAKF